MARYGVIRCDFGKTDEEVFHDRIGVCCLC